MKAFTIVPAILICCSLNSCGKNDLISDPSLAPPGSYSYASYDSLGVRIVEGWFTLLIADSAHVTGEWHFTQIAGGAAIGPQVGNGNLEGGFHSHQLWVELNPQYRDHNLLLGGTYSDTAYVGTWQAIGIMGIYNYGAFFAARR
jgi:hypothetical protein